MLEACQQALRLKSIGLCDTFAALVQQECSRCDGHGFSANLLRALACYQLGVLVLSMQKALKGIPALP